MIWLRVYTHPLRKSPTNFTLSMYLISLDVFVLIVASAAYVYQNLSNIGDALRTGTVVIGVSQALGMFVCVGRSTAVVKLLHIKLQAIVDQAAKGIVNVNQCIFISKPLH